MCPGIAVAGGGGDGGGGSGGSAKKGKGKKGAGKKKGKKGAKGDKKKGKCGKGTKAKCSKCGSKPTAGEPVDIASGAVFIPSTVDMFLPGPIELEWQRSYNTALSDVDCGLGFGWTFTFGWRFDIRGAEIHVTDGSGDSTVFWDCPVGDSSESPDGWFLERGVEGYTVWCGDEFLHLFRPLPSRPSHYVLAVVLGPSGNEIRLLYDQAGRLTEVIDSAGRTIRVTRNPAGQIACVDVPEPRGSTIAFATYAYDERGDLVAFRDADGNTWRYAYDESHRLTEQHYPSGLTFHYCYESRAGRCFESWGDYPGGVQDPAIDTDAPKLLADGLTPAKGLFHVKMIANDDFREVVSATELQRYVTDKDGEQVTKAVGNGAVTTRAFDEAGLEIALTDGNGNTTTYDYDEAGRLIRETDPLGRSMQLVRDEAGYVMQMIDGGGGVISVTRDDCNFIDNVRDQRGGVTSYVWDSRGLMREQIHPNGARSTYEVDTHGNLTRATLPDGAVWNFRYDWWGRMTGRVDPLGNVTEYRNSLAGLLVACRERDGGWTTIYRDEMTNPIEIVLPDGNVERRRWSGIHWLYEETSPGGIVTKAAFDQDSNLLRLVDGRGESMRFAWGPEGAPHTVELFGGREEHRTFDAFGEMLSEDVGVGKAAFEYDAVGNLVATEYPDGLAETFEYDARDELVRATGPNCELIIERDAVGDIVSESMTVDGETIKVTSEFMADGSRRKLATSLDLALTYDRDLVAQTSRVHLDNKRSVTFERNPLGGVVRMGLPEGGAIETSFDALTRVDARRVQGPSAERRDFEPEWVGLRVTGVIRKSYTYSPTSLVLNASNNQLGAVQYEYDRDGRLVASRREGRADELFAYDAASNLYETGGTREYDRANRLLAIGTTRYEYDAADRPVRKTTMAADGAELVWEYEWSGADLLSSVTRPDGKRVLFTYDPFARRTTKRLVDPTSQRSLSYTRYVWDESRLVQERTTRYDDDGRELGGELRSYAFEDRNLYVPFAEHLVVRTAEGLRDEGWTYFCADIKGAPEELVSGDGALVGVLDRSAFGAVTPKGARTTNLRFPGQYQDDETGLFYNLNRYYDPEVGRYLNPDPYGVEGGFNLFAYCTNPVTSFDPHGLHGMFFEVFDKGGNAVGPDPGNATGPGNWSPLKSGKNGYPFQKKKFGQLGSGDTEQKALSLLDKNDNARKALQKGGKAKMGGQFPPCKNCHRAIKKWMQENGGKGKIEYHYPANQKITYNGGKSKKPPVQTKKGSAADKLVDAYDNDKIKKFKTPKPVLNKDGSQKMKNGKPVMKSQESSASKEYQAQKKAAKKKPDEVGWPKPEDKAAHEAVPKKARPKP